MSSPQDLTVIVERALERARSAGADSVDALLVQIRKDVEQTRAILEPSRGSAPETT